MFIYIINKLSHMDFLWAILGICILIFISLDILWTTLLIAGGGPLTNKVISGVWAVFLTLNQKSGKHRILPYGGVVVILVNLVCWVGLTYLGWVLIFCSHDQAVLESQSKLPADLVSRIYFAGYTLITLGIGDYVPGTDLFKVITIVASANGFIFVTLAITYLLPIVSAVVQKRQFGSYVFSLGATPASILNNAWDGKGYSALSPHLTALLPQVLELGQKHLAYPILHCFHTPERQTATAPNLVALDETLSILEYYIPPNHQPDNLSVSPLRHAISLFLAHRYSTSLEKDVETPPLPSLDGILAKVESTTQTGTGMEAIIQRRKMLHSLLLHDGWEWKEVMEPPKTSNADLLANPTLMNEPAEE